MNLVRAIRVWWRRRKLKESLYRHYMDWLDEAQFDREFTSDRKRK